MNNDSTRYFIILRLPEEENYTSKSLSALYSKNAPTIYPLTGKHLESLERLRSAQEASFFTNSYRGSHFYDPSHARKISLYIYFPRCPSPFFETIPRPKYEIDEANIKKRRKRRRRSENKRRKDRIGRRKAGGREGEARNKTSVALKYFLSIEKGAVLRDRPPAANAG